MAGSDVARHRTTAVVWSETWGATGRLSFVTAEDTAGKLPGILPLGRPRVGPLTLYASGGHDVPRRGIIVAKSHEAEVGATIGDFIANQQWPLVQLGPQCQGSITDHALIQRLSQREVALYSRAWCEEIALHAPKTWDEYENTVISRKLEYQIRTSVRDLTRDGDFEVRHFRQPNTAECDELFHALARIEAASWMGIRDDAILRFNNPDLCHF